MKKKNKTKYKTRNLEEQKKWNERMDKGKLKEERERNRVAENNNNNKKKTTTKNDHNKGLKTTRIFGVKYSWNLLIEPERQNEGRGRERGSIQKFF